MVSLAAIQFSTVLSSSNDWERYPVQAFEDDFENWMFLFDSSRHEVVSPAGQHDSWWVPGSFEEAHTLMQGSNGAIIVGEVVGPSINRITESVRTSNHVVTPVLVHDVMFLGEEVSNVIVGEIVDVMEGYYYVTPETSAHRNGRVPVGTLITQFGTIPMEVGNRYVIILDGNAGERSWVDSERIFNATGREGVFPLTPRAPRLEDPNRPHIAEWQSGMMSLYGHLENIPSPSYTPLPEPTSSEQLIITVQGVRDKTIYDHNGNALIREGRGLYMQQGDQLIKVGERVPQSFAMQRFHYILEPGEYFFKDMDFTNGIAEQIVVAGVRGYEHRSVVRYLDFAQTHGLTPGSNLTLRVTPTSSRLYDSSTGAVVNPSEVYPPTLGFVPVGETVKLMVEDELRDFIVVHQGSPGPGYVGFENTTLLMPEKMLGYITSAVSPPIPSHLLPRQMHSTNVIDYHNSDLHAWLNSTYLSKLDSSIVDFIQEVRIPFSTGSGPSQNVMHSENGLSTRVFLPSLTEIGFTPFWGDGVFRVEGSKFDYFLEGTSPEATQLRITNNFAGFTMRSWTRSLLPVAWMPANYTPFAAPNAFGVLDVNGRIVHLTATQSTGHGGFRPIIPISSSLIVLDNRELHIPDEIPAPPPAPPALPFPDPTLLRDMPIGSIVILEYNGQLREFTVIQQGSPGEKYIGFEDVTVVLPIRAVGNMVMNTTGSNSYEDSIVHAWLNGNFLNFFNDGIRDFIPEVRIPFRPGSGISQEVRYGENGLLTGPFLLSRAEVGTPNTVNGMPSANIPLSEGSKFDFFTDDHDMRSANIQRFGFSSTHNYVTEWFLRTPVTNGSDRFWTSTPNGGILGGFVNRPATLSLNIDIRPAIPLLSSLMVSYNGKISIPVNVPTPEPTPTPQPTPTPITLESIPVGDIIKLEYNGEMTNFIVVQQGSPSSDYIGLDDATIVMMERSLPKHLMHSHNINDYQNSDMHLWLNSTFLDSFEISIKNSIPEIMISFRSGSGTSRSISSGSHGLSTRAFILSTSEVGWSSDIWSEAMTDAEGIMFDFFIEGSTEEANQRRVDANNWWLRSPGILDSTFFWFVNSFGDGGLTNASFSEFAVRPAFALPSSLHINDYNEVVVQ